MLNSFDFNGRPDGLGNRLVELICLEIYCIKNNLKCNYYWRNQYAFRTYKNLFECENITIQDKIEYKIDYKTNKIPVSLEFYTKDEIYNAAKNINLKYNLPKLDYEYIAIHIRGTDKLLNRTCDEFTLDFFQTNLDKCIKIINNLSSENFNVVICSDDITIKNHFIDQLNNNIIVKEPYNNIDLPENYKDFYKLVGAKEIYMVPKFSSYASCASILGNNILHSFVDEKESSLWKYKCNIKMESQAL